MFIGDGRIFVVGVRAFIVLLYERNNIFYCNEKINMPLEFSCYSELSALNNVSYHFLLLYSYAVLSV